MTTKQESQTDLYSVLNQAWYCSSLTCSIQSALLSSSISTMAMCVIAVVGTARFRRMVRNYERSAEALVGLHIVAFAMSLAYRFVTFMVQGA